MTPTRHERVHASVDTGTKRSEGAAPELRLSVSAVVLQATQQGAGQETIRLSPDAAAAFEEALSRPALVNESLVRSLDYRTKLSWID